MLPGDAASPRKNAARVLLRSTGGESVKKVWLQCQENKDAGS